MGTTESLFFRKGTKTDSIYSSSPKMYDHNLFGRWYLVRTLEHDSNMWDGSESWNLLTKDNMDISYGIYIYHVDAPGVSGLSVGYW